MRFTEIDGDAAVLQSDAVRKVFEFLIDDGSGRFDQQLRLSDTLLAKTFDEPRHFRRRSIS